jgi:hypothetical protein
MKNVPNKLRVLHYPQVPCKPYIVEVADELQAYFTINLLAKQHLFLFDNNFIPDYSNILLVQMWEESLDHDGDLLGDWVDYYNEEEGMDWEEIEQYFESLK